MCWDRRCTFKHARKGLVLKRRPHLPSASSRPRRPHDVCSTAAFPPPPPPRHLVLSPNMLNMVGGPYVPPTACSDCSTECQCGAHKFPRPFSAAGLSGRGGDGRAATLHPPPSPPRGGECPPMSYGAPRGGCHGDAFAGRRRPHPRPLRGRRGRVPYRGRPPPSALSTLPPPLPSSCHSTTTTTAGGCPTWAAS